ncbi:MAG: hypothetical protein ACBZ72_04550 [Candidatus Bathyarchaeia archaeon]|jgi:hypothetical protein
MVKVEVEVDLGMLQFCLRSLPYLSYDSPEDLVKDAVASRMEKMLHLAALAHENPSIQTYPQQPTIGDYPKK